MHRIDFEGCGMPGSMFGRLLPQEWKDKFVKHVVEYCPDFGDDEDLVINIKKEDIPDGLKYDYETADDNVTADNNVTADDNETAHYDVTAELNLFTTHEKGPRKSKYAFKSVRLSLDISITCQDRSSWGDGINYELDNAEWDIRVFSFDQKTFKVGRDGVLTIFSCWWQHALVIVFEKHFALLEISTDQYNFDVNSANKQYFSCVDVQLVSLLQGIDKVNLFMDEMDVEGYNGLDVKTQDFTLPETSEKLKHLMMSHHPRLGKESGLKNIHDLLIMYIMRPHLLNNQELSGKQVREYLISLASASPVYEGAKFCLLCMKNMPAVGL
jgi:hypothetical protein